MQETISHCEKLLLVMGIYQPDEKQPPSAARTAAKQVAVPTKIELRVKMSPFEGSNQVDGGGAARSEYPPNG